MYLSENLKLVGAAGLACQAGPESLLSLSLLLQVFEASLRLKVKLGSHASTISTLAPPPAISPDLELARPIVGNVYTLTSISLFLLL